MGSCGLYCPNLSIVLDNNSLLFLSFSLSRFILYFSRAVFSDSMAVLAILILVWL
jgi:hypothetical protein